jgi:subtilisin family serine protease
MASGASYATAFVAGTAALLDSYLGPTPPASVIQRLERTAVRAGTTVPDPRVGFGVVDPYAALSVVAVSEHRVPASAPAGRRMVVPQAPSRAATRTALAVAAASIGLLMVVGFVMLTVLAHRRRKAARSD